MENKKLNISELYGIPGEALFESFIHSDTQENHKYVQNLPCMIVCPGGAYRMTSDREAEPIAIDFYNRNYNTFVLRYAVAPARYPLAITQLACAVDYVRRHAEELRVDPNRIFVTGFSAGGHLVGSFANLWSELPSDFVDPATLDCRPNGILLGYPVIFPESHRGSFKNLLGDDYESHPALPKLILHESVNDNNPPCFIWTTAEDAAVNPTATTSYTAALLARKIRCECHIFPTGGHGSSTCDARSNERWEQYGNAGIWLDLAAEFFSKI